MMERFRRGGDPEATTAGATSATSTMTDRRAAELEAEERAAAERDHGADGTRVIDRHGADETRVVDERDTRFHRGGGRRVAEAAAIDSAAMTAARRRQREEFGGIHWGAAFFGFLAAAGLAAILTSIVSAAGATLTFGQGKNVSDAAKTIGIAGGIAMLVVLVVSYFAGGYVAGRMSRFDGARQGLGVWLVALVVTVILAVAGAILGGQYNVLQQLNLPRIPIDEGTIATGAIIALLIAVIGSLLAAMAGGKAGERYHRRIDRFAVDG